MSEFIANTEKRKRIFRELTDSILDRALDRSKVEAHSAWIEAATPSDIARLVDGYVAEGIEFTRLKPLVSALLNLFHRPLASFRYAAEPTRERFLASLAAEDRALSALLDSLKRHMGDILLREGNDAAAGAATEISRALARSDILFRKKENILFPRFEARFPEYRCVRLMWSIHDDARRSIAEFIRALEAHSFPRLVTKPNPAGPATGRAAPDGVAVPAIDPALAASAGRLFFNLSTLVFRDECILYPLMASLFGEEELEEMYGESHEPGFAFLGSTEAKVYEDFVPVPGRQGPQPLAPGATEVSEGPGEVENAGEEKVDLGSGSLSPRILSTIFRTIGQDMTFVDADDRVAFFTEGPERVFPRSRSIIGRRVADCHPHESVDRVMRIIGSFRSGESDRECFWLNQRGRFIHIEYRALRSPRGDYLGTLETSEDLTEKRSLTGEKRL